MWWSPRAVGLHVTAAVVIPGCLVLCWWQVLRALSGNGLSWVYVFEWPLFAGYGAFMWWRLVHEQPGGNPAGDARGREQRPLGGDGEETELAAYNRYLAELHASGQRKRW